MCCCDKPTVNGTGPVKMTFESPASNYPPNPPDLQDGDVLLYDEPGRCGGMDSHSHHFRVVRRCGALYLLVRHGGGDESMRFGWANTVTEPLDAVDSNGRYWLLCAVYHAMKHAEKTARDTECARWQQAAAEKRIKTRKQPSRGFIKVWIEPPAIAAEN